MATTTIQPLPYPGPGDSPDVPRDLKALAEAVEDRTVMRFASTAARDAAIPSGQRVAGMHAYIEAENAVYVWTGTGWTLAWSLPTVTTVSSGDISVAVVRCGASVEVRIEVTATGVSGNVVYLSGGAELIPAGLRPAWQTPGAGWGDRPGVAILPVAFSVNTNGSIVLLKDPAITEGFRGVVRYMIA